jgi:hypothetical protein
MSEHRIIDDHRIIDVHRGSTSEAWLVVYRDGRIEFHWENDGYRFLRRGSEAVDRWIDLAEVEQMDRCCRYRPNLMSQVQKALAELREEHQ